MYIENKTGTLSASVVVNHEYNFDIRGALHIKPNYFDMRCAAFSFAKGRYRWVNDDTMHVQMFEK